MNVLHFRDGSTADFESTPDIDMNREVVIADGDRREEVPFADLKAVFFLNDDRPREGSERPEGSFLAVEFADGEVIRGFARYNPALPGFYLYPAEEGRNERLFVVTAAIQSIEIEKV